MKYSTVAVPRWRLCGRCWIGCKFLLGYSADESQHVAVRICTRQLETYRIWGCTANVADAGKISGWSSRKIVRVISSIS